MQHVDLKLEIASRVLSGIIAQDRNRNLDDRLDDIRHSLDVAAELIRQRDERSPPDFDLTLDPPRIKTREAVILREEVPLQELRIQRQKSAPPRATDMVKGPTLH